MKIILLQLDHLAMDPQAAPLPSFYLLVSIEVFFLMQAKSISLFCPPVTSLFEACTLEYFTSASSVLRTLVITL